MLYDIAIIGAGPSGIATAIEAYAMGLEKIILFEKGENHNMTIRKYYKDNKRVDKDWQGQKVDIEGRIHFVDGTKESTIDLFDALLKEHACEMLTHTEIFKVERDGKIFLINTDKGAFEAKKVVVSIGRMGKPNKPSYKIPSALKKIVNFSLEFCSLDENILVVGGGDSATEYAVELSNKNRVALNYRRNSFSRLNDTNLKAIETHFDSGKIEPILGVDIESIEEDDGKVKVVFTDGERCSYDRVIYAIGGTTPSTFLHDSKIAIENGVPLYDENYETNVAGIYVAGDITQERGGSIALGLNHAHKIAEHILSAK